MTSELYKKNGIVHFDEPILIDDVDITKEILKDQLDKHELIEITKTSPWDGGEEFFIGFRFRVKKGDWGKCEGEGSDVCTRCGDLSPCYNDDSGKSVCGGCYGR